MVTETREKLALEYEGKTFLKENDIVIGCEINGANRTYCSVCDWVECWDRDIRSFPKETA